MTKFQKNPGSPWSIIRDNTASSLDAAPHSAQAQKISSRTRSALGTLGTLVSSKAVLSGTEWREPRA